MMQEVLEQIRFCGCWGQVSFQMVKIEEESSLE